MQSKLASYHHPQLWFTAFTIPPPVMAIICAYVVWGEIVTNFIFKKC